MLMAGGGFLRNPIAWWVLIAWGVLETPPLFFRNCLWGGFKGVFRCRHTISAKIFLGGILLDYTSKVLSWPPMQALLILPPLLGTPENAGVT